MTTNQDPADQTPANSQAPESAAPEAAPAADATPSLEEQAAKAEEYLNLAKRTQADFINYRRRTEEERAQRALEANRDFILRLLPILDDFERAQSAAGPDELNSNWGKGVQLIERNLRTMLSNADVQPIQALGAEFNPWEHEALAHQPTDDAEEGSVLQVVRTGYKQGDRVIRPAQVVVARRPG